MKRFIVASAGFLAAFTICFVGMLVIMNSVGEMVSWLRTLGN